ncbi:hypothetical protein WN943_026554 [Citrus x changshan-huyou]
MITRKTRLCFPTRPISSSSQSSAKAQKRKTHSSKRLALSEPSGCGSSSRLKKEKFDPPPFIVLGLPIQDNKLALPVADPLVGSIGLQPVNGRQSSNEASSPCNIDASSSPMSQRVEFEKVDIPSTIDTPYLEHDTGLRISIKAYPIDK